MSSEQAFHKHFNLSQELAIARTSLGNVRTYLATIRTSIALLGLGAGFWKLFTHGFFHTLGLGALAISILVFIYGTLSYKMYKAFIDRISVQHDHLQQYYLDDNKTGSSGS